MASQHPSQPDAASYSAPSIGPDSRANSVAKLLIPDGALPERRQSTALGGGSASATGFASMLDAPVARRASGAPLPTGTGSADREPFSLHRALADTTPVEPSDSGYARSSSGSFDRGRTGQGRTSEDPVPGGAMGGVGPGPFDSFRGEGANQQGFAGHGHSEHGGRLLTVSNVCSGCLSLRVPARC